MATNYIKRFAQYAGPTNILTPAQYDIDPRRLSGHLPGVADNALENTALQQTSLMTSALGLFAANNQLQDITTSLTEVQIATFIENAIKSVTGFGNYVDLTTAQTVGGVKTFTLSPIVPTPTTATQAANKGYIDTAITTVTSGYVTKGTIAGPNVSQTIYGEKYFQNKIEVPTANLFDASPNAASTDFVMRAIGNTAGMVVVTGSTTIYNTHAGLSILAYNTSNITLAAPATFRTGSVLRIFVHGPGPTIVVAGGVSFSVGGGAARIVTSLTLHDGDEITAWTDGYTWFVFGSGALKNNANFFYQAIGSTIVQALPSGLMTIMGEVGPVDSDTFITLTFPYAFSSTPLVLAGIRDPFTGNRDVFGKVVGNPTTTQVQLRAEWAASSGSNTDLYLNYIAKGLVNIGSLPL